MDWAELALELERRHAISGHAPRLDPLLGPDVERQGGGALSRLGARAVAAQAKRRVPRPGDLLARSDLDVEVGLLGELGAGGRRGAHQRHGARGQHGERPPHRDSLRTVWRTVRRQAARPARLARHLRFALTTARWMQDFRPLPDSSARQLRIAEVSVDTRLAGCALPGGAA